MCPCQPTHWAHQPGAGGGQDSRSLREQKVEGGELQGTRLKQRHGQGSCRGAWNTKVGALCAQELHTPTPATLGRLCVKGRDCHPPTHPLSAPRPLQGKPEPLTICSAAGVQGEGPWWWGEFLDPGKADHPSRSLRHACKEVLPCSALLVKVSIHVQVPSIFASAAFITLSRRACLCADPSESRARGRDPPSRSS